MEIHSHREFVYPIEQETTRLNNFGTRTAKTGIVVGKKKTPHFLRESAYPVLRKYKKRTKVLA